MSETTKAAEGAALMASMAAQRMAIMQAMEAIQAALLAQEEAMRGFLSQQDDFNQEQEGNLRKSVKALAKVAQQVQDLENRMTKLESNTSWMT